MTADAYATAFMVMGLEEAEDFCQSDPTINAYFIYSGENGEFETYFTEGMKKYIKEITKKRNIYMSHVRRGSPNVHSIDCLFKRFANIYFINTKYTAAIRQINAAR